MKVCQLRIGDGRDELHERSAQSLAQMLPLPAKVVAVDDADHKLGFAGAIAEGWRKVLATGCDYVWHAEMDFTYSRPVPLERMAAVLKARPYLLQIALKRQPVNEQEQAAGGIVEMYPDDYTQVTAHGDVWTEHRKFFTTNPSLYPVALCNQGWPQVEHSEGQFGIRMFEDPNARSAFWGAKFDPPLCEHLGERVGTGY